MLSEIEIAILKILADRHLITRSELTRLLSKEENGASMADVSVLVSKGLVKRLQGLTQENSFVITQSGLRIMKEI